MDLPKLQFPLTYNGPIKVKLEIPYPEAHRGSVRDNNKSTKNSKNLSIDFRYHERIYKTTGLLDTPYNQVVAQAILNEIIYRIDHGVGDNKFVFELIFPDASREQKERIARYEKRKYYPPPDQVTFGEYVMHWEEEYLPLLSASLRSLAHDTLKSRLLPFFENLTFFDITRPKMRKFVAQLRKVDGEPLSKKRIVNMMSIMRRIWADAVDEYHWELKDPFEGLSRHYPQPNPQERIVFRFDEYMKMRSYLPEFYHPIVDFMMLTGASPSEISGLKRQHIVDGVIHFQESRVDKYHDNEVGYLKEKSRNRKMPITKAIQQRLDILLSRTDGDLVFVRPDGTVYKHDKFRENYWNPAVKAAGLDGYVPYALRHSFTAWCLAIDVHMNRIVSLMGHASKEMVYERYGKYVEALELDKDKILKFYGSDFDRSDAVIEQPLRPGGGNRRGWKGKRKS